MSMASAKTRVKGGGLGETIKIVIQALFLALLVRTFLFQPFNIPSGSMKDTLLINDYLFVSKYAYGYSRYSFPWGLDLVRLLSYRPAKDEIAEVFLPGESTPRKVKVLAVPGEVVALQEDGAVDVKSSGAQNARAQYPVPVNKYYVVNEDGTPFNYGKAFEDILLSNNDLPIRFMPVEWFAKYGPRIWATMPKRGDVVVFKLPRDDSTDYIKRVIGLPGDKIQMIHGILQINGEPVKWVRDGDYVTRDAFGAETKIERYRETLPNGVSYETLDMNPNGFEDNTPVFVVPHGEFFMMGDNRDNSTDSRVPPSGGVGYVPFENLVGRAEVIFFSVDEDAAAWEFWKWPWSVRWERLFKLL